MSSSDGFWLSYHFILTLSAGHAPLLLLLDLLPLLQKCGDVLLPEGQSCSHLRLFLFRGWRRGCGGFFGGCRDCRHRWFGLLGSLGSGSDHRLSRECDTGVESGLRSVKAGAVVLLGAALCSTLSRGSRLRGRIACATCFLGRR